MTRYTIIEDSDKRILIREVEKLLAEGWAVHGGLCVSVSQPTNTSSKDVRYTQALIKEVANCVQEAYEA